MSKRQDNLHKQSLVRIANYEALPSSTKTGHTKPGEVSCKRVNKAENQLYSVSSALMSVSKKGAKIDDVRRSIDFSSPKDTIGIGTRGKAAFLRKNGYYIIGI